jgi:hypothetical protein
LDDCQDPEDYAQIAITISDNGEVLDWDVHGNSVADEEKFFGDLVIS